MAFTSLQYLVFLALLVLLLQLLKGRFKSGILLFASFYFIAAFNVYSLFLIVFFSSLTFVAALRITAKKNTALYYFTLLMNAFAIVLFNYVLQAKGSVLFSFQEVDFNPIAFVWIVGLSFYNLQHMAYLVDVQKGRIQPERNYLDFLLISAYFPKFLCGPLVLYQQMKTQLPDAPVQKPVLWLGFNRILFGIFKKMVIADRLAPSVHSVFDYQDQLPGLSIITGAVLFTIQLYFDFSAYSDIAIGSSKMLGIDLPENFDFPLRAGSVTVFWRRWHKSLMHFFSSYVFYPLSFRFRRLKKQAVAFAIVCTFLFSGLWHGIGFTFLAWAICHICYLLFELYLPLNRVPVKAGAFKKVLSALFVLLLVSFSNIFFRSTTTQGSLRMVSQLFQNSFLPLHWLKDFIAPLAVGGHQAELFNFYLTLCFVLIFLFFERKLFMQFNYPAFKPLLSLFVLLLILLFGVFNSGQRFIYMQF